MFEFALVIGFGNVLALVLHAFTWRCRQRDLTCIALWGIPFIVILCVAGIEIMAAVFVVSLGLGLLHSLYFHGWRGWSSNLWLDATLANIVEAFLGLCVLWATSLVFGGRNSLLLQWCVGTWLLSLVALAVFRPLLVKFLMPLLRPGWEDEGYSIPSPQERRGFEL